MVKVELTYNPYLMKTEVLFDGRKPRINSLVEKYQDRKLQDWIKNIPDIFYNEMNGFGFELEFSGTKMDFNQLVQTFRDAGITEDQVILFHKNEISEREQKVQDLEALLDWLRINKNNGVFSFEEFEKTQGTLLNPDYSFIVLNGNNLISDQNTETLKISVENVDSINELRDAELGNTPILVCVTRTILPQLQSIISDLKQREDVTENQLFFTISPYLNKEMVIRTIYDLGIQVLQVVDSPLDDIIRDFYYAYPVTDHLSEAVKVLNDECNRVRGIVNERKQESEITNQSVHEQIREIDEVIESLKTALISIETRDNVELPDICIEAQTALRKSIENWRKNKIKFSEEYAKKYAYEYEKYLNEHFLIFIKTVVGTIKAKRWRTIRHFQDIYRRTEYDEFGAEWPKAGSKMYQLPLVAEELLNHKEEMYVSPKDDFMDMFIKDHEEPKELVLRTTYYNAEWREYAMDTYIPLSIQIINEQYEILKKSIDGIAAEYISHLEKALLEEKSKKDRIVLQLSKEELMLENDMDWTTTFTDKVEKLERG